MLVLVPLVLGLAWLQVHWHRRTLGFAALSRRGTLVVAFAVVQLALLSTTELLSIGQHLTGTAVRTVWGVACIALGAASVRRAVVLVRSNPVRRLAARVDTLDLEGWALLSILLFVSGALVLMALAYPPSNTDSLMYHLPRVEQWIQNASVRHFSAHYLAQIELAPLHEFNLLHLHALFGGDRFDGFVQLLSAGVAVAGVSELTRLLGGGRRAQLLAAFVAAAAPSLLLEATSTQNNDFAAVIAVALLVVLLAWRPGVGWVPRSAIAGALGGLALLAKGSLVVMVAPAAVALGCLALLAEWRSRPGRAAVRRMCAATTIVVVAACACAGPFLVRNHQVFDAFTGPESEMNISAELGPRAALANVVRSTSTNFRIGDGRGVEGTASRVAFSVLRPIFELTGVDGRDTRYRLGTDARSLEPGDYAIFQRVEEYGANPSHVVLLVVSGAGVVVAAARGRRELRTAALVAVGLTVGFVAFTALNRWSPFTVRYQVPLLMGWSAVIGLALARLPKWVGRGVLALLVLGAAGPLLRNFARPIVDPKVPFETYLDGFYAGGAGAIGPPLEEFDQVARSMASSGCAALAITNYIQIEYPLWVALDHHDWDGRIQHLDVPNPSARLIPRSFEPCATIHQIVDDAAEPPEVHLVLEFLPRP